MGRFSIFRKPIGIGIDAAKKGRKKAKNIFAPTRKSPTSIRGGAPKTSAPGTPPTPLRSTLGGRTAIAGAGVGAAGAGLYAFRVAWDAPSPFKKADPNGDPSPEDPGELFTKLLGDLFEGVTDGVGGLLLPAALVLGAVLLARDK